MNKSLRKLASLFGGSNIPQAGRNGRLDMGRYMIRETLFRQCDAHIDMMRITRGTFVHVVKAGLKSSVVRVFGHEIVVENKYIKQS